MSALVVFDPIKVQLESQVPIADFDSISFNHDDSRTQLAYGTRQLTLGPDDRDLRVTARLHSLADARTWRYRFRLKGYDADWVEDSEGERVFTRLEHGHYTLEMIAANAAGVWSKPRRLEIEVLPAWWQTTWARMLFVLAGLLAIAGFAAVYRAPLREIHANQLREQRRELAERASEAKTRFLADFGHEIRTPMTGVLGMAELLHAEPLGPRQRGRVEAIQTAGQHLLRLVDDALDVARIEAGRLDLLDAAFDVPALVAEAEALLRPQAEAKGLAFSVVHAPDAPPVLRGDAGRVRQILLNLGQNAVKFTARGEVWLRIQAPTDGDGVVFEIADTGPGLDAAQQAQLFRRFVQADGARTWMHHGGSGLGLAICQQLAQAMGGEITVESVLGAGATFTVRLPLAKETLPTRGPSNHVREGGPGLGVLVVEDDALVAEVVRGLLEQHGHRVMHTAHGLAALAEVSTGHFDIALLDLDLPGLDGLELARLIHAHSPHLPLVALTARADGEAEPQARAAGMVGFLRKPVTGDELAATVARHVRTIPEPIPA
jgi:signal transduction histidine kinase/CheY-like chemotaxis protein